MSTRQAMPLNRHTEVVVEGGEGEVRAIHVVHAIHAIGSSTVVVGGVEIGIIAVGVKRLRAHGVEDGAAAGIRRLLRVHVLFHHILEICQSKVIASIYPSNSTANTSYKAP